MDFIHGWVLFIHVWYCHPSYFAHIDYLSQKLPHNFVKHGQYLTDYNSIHGWIPWMEEFHPWMTSTDEDDGHGRSQYVLAYIFVLTEFQFFYKPQWCRCKWLCTTIWHTHAILENSKHYFCKRMSKITLEQMSLIQKPYF